MQQLEWPKRQPQVIKPFAFDARVAQFVKRTPSVDEVIEFTRQMRNFYSVHIGDFKTRAQKFLDLALTVDQSKQKAIGRDAPTTTSNFIIHCLALSFAETVYPDKEELDFLILLKEKLRTNNEFFNSWFYPKISNYLNCLVMKFYTRAYAESLTVAASHEQLENVRRVLDLDNAIAELMGGLAELRKYGVKSSFFQDGILHALPDAWVFRNFDDLRTAVREDTAQALFPVQSSPLALISLAPRMSITDLRPRGMVKIGVGYNLVHSDSSFRNSGFIWGLTKQGQLDASMGYGMMPVSDIFAAAGKETEYELVRLSHVLRLHDLTVPLTVVSEVPALPGNKRGFRSAIAEIFRRTRNIVSADLIIPRMRRLQDKNLYSELEIEIDAAEKETKRRLKIHEVIWHIRRLPRGHHPSREARLLAFEKEVRLAENETFVRKHIRGTEQPAIASHRAIVRAD